MNNSLLTNKDLLTLWKAAEQWINDIVLGKATAWLRKVKIKWFMLINVNCMLFAPCLNFYWLMGSGHWPSHIIKQKCNGNGPNVISLWNVTPRKWLWEYKEWVKEGYFFFHVHQKNPFPARVIGTSKYISWCNLLEVATWVHETSGYGVTTAMQRWAESKHVLLYPLRHRMPTRTFPSTNKKDIPQGVGPYFSGCIYHYTEIWCNTGY